MQREMGVITVYTCDYLDQEEVNRVATNLHEKMEYKKTMYYKTDDQTIAGAYAKNGSKVNHVYRFPLDRDDVVTSITLYEYI